jgi:hypothetical protein
MEGSVLTVAFVVEDESVRVLVDVRTAAACDRNLSERGGASAANKLLASPDPENQAFEDQPSFCIDPVALAERYTVLCAGLHTACETLPAILPSNSKPSISTVADVKLKTVRALQLLTKRMNVPCLSSQRIKTAADWAVCGRSQQSFGCIGPGNL